jgi:hypothetical protein
VLNVPVPVINVRCLKRTDSTTDIRTGTLRFSGSRDDQKSGLSLGMVLVSRVKLANQGSITVEGGCSHAGKIICLPESGSCCSLKGTRVSS